MLHKRKSIITISTPDKIKKQFWKTVKSLFSDKHIKYWRALPDKIIFNDTKDMKTWNKTVNLELKIDGNKIRNEMMTFLIIFRTFLINLIPILVYSR